jgi:hypothetical protein
MSNYIEDGWYSCESCGAGNDLSSLDGDTWECRMCDAVNSCGPSPEERIAELEADQRRLEWLVEHQHCVRNIGGFSHVALWCCETSAITDPKKCWRDAIDEAMGAGDD